MNDRPDARQPTVPAGLCTSCAYSAIIITDRGSQFVRCGRSRIDAAFPKYPRLPVIACPGYQEKAG
jgi:hypothetical protein